MTPLDKYHRLAGMESPISALLPFSFYNFFLLAAPLPFVETSHSRKANWKPLCEKSGSPCRFSFQFHFFSMRISLSSKDGLPTLLSTLGCPIPYAMTFFLIGRYFVCYSLNSNHKACLALALLFFTDFRTDVSPLCQHLDLLFFLIITGLLVSHFP